MDSKNLAKEALALGKELGVEISVNGLNRSKLEALVADLRSQKAARSSEAPVGGGAVRKPKAGGSASKGDSKGPSAEPAASSSEGAGSSSSNPTGDSPEQGSPAPKRKGSRVVVAPGRSVTSRRGILGPGSEVVPDDFAGDGQSVIKRLLSRGVFVRE